jgi:hypothetical protein
MKPLVAPVSKGTDSLILLSETEKSAGPASSSPSVRIASLYRATMRKASMNVVGPWTRVLTGLGFRRRVPHAGKEDPIARINLLSVQRLVFVAPLQAASPESGSIVRVTGSKRVRQWPLFNCQAAQQSGYKLSPCECFIFDVLRTEQVLSVERGDSIRTRLLSNVYPYICTRTPSGYDVSSSGRRRPRYQQRHS